MQKVSDSIGDLSCWQKLRHRALLVWHRLCGRDYGITVPMLGHPVTLLISNGRELKRVAEVSYEGLFLGRILESLRPGDVFFDIGANIGLVSLIVSTLPQFAGGVIHAFEPEPRNLDHLRRNFEVNRLQERAFAHGVALSRAEGMASLFVRGATGDGRHSLVSTKGARGTVEVQVTTVSHFCEKQHVLPTVIKIDVEGAEGAVLAGMEGLLTRGRPRDLFMEIHNKGGEDRMPDGSLIDGWLEERGYLRLWEERRGHGRHRHYRDRAAVD